MQGHYPYLFRGVRYTENPGVERNNRVRQEGCRTPTETAIPVAACTPAASQVAPATPP